jgi:hypothetical protein
VYEVGVLPSMTKGDIVGHSVINVLSLMSNSITICKVHVK